MMQNRIIIGKIIRYGIFSTLTHIPIRGRFKTSSMTFPIYMEATMPQNTSGCSAMSMGPGRTPWIMRAANSRATVAFIGIPRDSRGMRAPPAAALFAASGPATPAISPVPNRSGCLERRFSMM